MEYFALSQKKGITNTAKLQIVANSPIEPKAEFLKTEADKIKQVTCIPVSGSNNNFYPEVIDKPVFIISEKIKKLLCIYDENIIWKFVTLIDFDNKKQNNYWLPLLDKIDCISDNTTFFKDYSLNKLVLDKSKIGKNKIFRIDKIREKIIVVNLDIAESLLRRFCAGIDLEKIDLY